MMIDKTSLTIAAVAAGAKLLAEVVPANAPAYGDIANLTAVGALIFLVVHTVPKLLKDHKEEREKLSEAHQEERKTWLDGFRAELKDIRDTWGGK